MRSGNEGVKIDLFKIIINKNKCIIFFFNYLTIILSPFQVGDKDFGWTLGYMTNTTKIIPVKATPRLISTTSLTVSLTLFIIVIAATAIFLLYTCKRNASGSGSPC